MRRCLKTPFRRKCFFSDSLAERYLADLISIFNEYGWDWTYHAFREWPGWSVEHEGPDMRNMKKETDTPRMRVLKNGLL